MPSMASSDHRSLQLRPPNRDGGSVTLPQDRPLARTYLWVNSDKDSPGDTVPQVARRAIQSHVMKDFTKKRKSGSLVQAIRINPDGEFPSTIHDVTPEYSQRCQDQNETREGGRMRTKGMRSFADLETSTKRARGGALIDLGGPPSSTLDRKYLDPFASAAVPVNSRMNELLCHFSNVVLPTIHPSERPNSWPCSSSQLLDSAPLIYATCAWNSVHQQILIGKFENPLNANDKDRTGLVLRESKEPLLLKSKALRLVNKAFLDPKEITGEFLYTTLITLCRLELLNRNALETRVHFNGLKQLAQQRGRSPDEVLRDLMTTDVSIAVVTMTPPCLPICVDPSEKDMLEEAVASVLGHQQTSISLLGPRLHSDVAINIDYRAYPVFHDLRILTMYRYLRNQNGTLQTPESVNFFFQRSRAIDHQLMSLLPEISSWNDAGLERAFVVATLIFTNWISSVTTSLKRSSGLRIREKYPPLILMEILEHIDLETIIAAAPTIIFWTLNIAVITVSCDKASAQRSWLMRHLHHCALKLGLNSWTDVRKLLEQFFYLPEKQDRPLGIVWDEMVLYMEATGLSPASGEQGTPSASSST